jgi:Flp pilus assembly pilin Flp
MSQFMVALYGLYFENKHTARPGGSEGQGLVEYGLILLFVALAVIVAMIFFGDRLSNIYSKIGNSIPVT